MLILGQHLNKVHSPHTYVSFFFFQRLIWWIIKGAPPQGACQKKKKTDFFKTYILNNDSSSLSETTKDYESWNIVKILNHSEKSCDNQH